MNVLDLFAGAAGGWSKGLARCGYTTVAACEIDDWRRAVFAAEHPGCVMYADVRELTAERLHHDLGYLPDVVIGSPPCQEISAANCKGTGITDDHLFWEWVRLVFEVRPVWCAAENSPRARTDGIDGILDALEQAGYAAWPCVVGADNAGANHRRKRLWLIAADAERIELWQQRGRSGGANGRGSAVAGEHDPDAEGIRGGGRQQSERRSGRRDGLGLSDAPENGADPDGRLAGGARRHPDGRVELGAGADGGNVANADEAFRRGSAVPHGATADYRLHDARHPKVVERLRLGGAFPGRGAEPAQAGLHPHCRRGNCCAEPNECDGNDCWLAKHPDELWRYRDAPHPDREGLAIGPRLALNHGEELPPALRDIGLAWPHWNGGLAGLAAACAAAGFGALDDGADAVLPAGLRNRAIAALGDAVIPQIPQAIGRAMREMFA